MRGRWRVAVESESRSNRILESETDCMLGRRRPRLVCRDRFPPRAKGFVRFAINGQQLAKPRDAMDTMRILAQNNAQLNFAG